MVLEKVRSTTKGFTMENCAFKIKYSAEVEWTDVTGKTTTTTKSMDGVGALTVGEEIAVNISGCKSSLKTIKEADRGAVIDNKVNSKFNLDISTTMVEFIKSMRR